MNADTPHPLAPPSGYLSELTLVEWLRTREARRGELPRIAEPVLPATPVAAR